jgi:hypothetical protein
MGITKNNIALLSWDQDIKTCDYVVVGYNLHHSQSVQ